MEEKQAQEEITQPSSLIPPSISDDQIQVKSDYVPKTSSNVGATSKCPICNQMFPVSEINEHIKIEQMNPKHLEEKRMTEIMLKQTNTITGEEISKNLQNIKSKRPDISGQIE